MGPDAGWVVARADYSSKWISNSYSRQLVHRWRTEEDAVMVGTKTAHYDDPKLNVRDWQGRNPVRVVIDRRLTLDNNLSLFDRSQPTICYNLVKDEIEEGLVYVKLDAEFFGSGHSGGSLQAENSECYC